VETQLEREERIARLERARGERAAGREAQVWPTPDDAGLELQVGPGRGDLNFSSTFYPSFPTSLLLVGNKVASFARIFMSQPWVAAAVMRMLTWSVRVPLKVYRRMDDENARQRVRGAEHPLASALEIPWERGTLASLVMSMFGPVLVHGNSVTEVLSGAKETITFMPHDWRFSRPLMPFRDSIDGFEFDIDIPELRRTVSVDDVLHIAWWSPTGPIGCSPLQQLGVTIRIEDAAQRYQQAMLLRQARPPSAIQASEDFLGIDKKERQQIIAQLRSDITAIYSGPENAGRPALLPPGLEWKPIGHTALEAALIDQRRVTREEVAGVYMIPPPLMGILDKATYSNIQAQREMTYTDCLGPPLVLIEQTINSQIVHSLLREDDLFVEFDFGAVLRGDRLQEIEALREAIGTALFTPNEGRDVLNLPRSEDPGMDQFYLPMNNLQPVGSPPTPGVIPAPVRPTRREREGKEVRRLHVRSSDRDYDMEFSA
jgi:HK97 family phage portal protein